MSPLIDWLNARSTSTSKLSSNKLKLTKLGLDTSHLGDNPCLINWVYWSMASLGNFYSNFSINSQGIAEEIRHYMRISQKAVYGKKSNLFNEDYSNKHIMEKIR